MLMSTDPAHSLSDSLDVAIGNKLTAIVSNIWGLEIDAAQLYREYMDKYGAVIQKITQRGTLLDKVDIEQFAPLSLPGLDEVMAITRIAYLVRAKEYDLIILDTAPTGHTLVLLSLPEKIEQWLRLLDQMMGKYRYLFKTMAGRYKKDECDEFIESQKEEIKGVRRLLTDPHGASFVPVTIAEPVSISEVQRLVGVLKRDKIPVHSIIINRVMQGDSQCPFCLSRRQQSEKYLQEIKEKFSPYELIETPLFPHQIRGVESLLEFAEFLFSQRKYLSSPRGEAISEATSSSQGGLSDILARELHLLIFGGKGGVGKSTLAAAGALYLAQHRPERKVLLFSTDPAHALSDVFRQPIGNQIQRISGIENLFALEMDGTQLLEAFKGRYRDVMDQAFTELAGGGADIKFDREISREFLSVSPPGLDELMAMMKIMELMQAGEYDFFVMDSAASGHLLRFLELPSLVQDWLKAAFHVVQKYKGVAKLTGAMELLLDLSRGVRQVREKLTDAAWTEFVMIAIPEAMGVAEMGDLAASIARLRVPSAHTIINMVIPWSDCGFCTVKRKEQQQYVREIQAKLPHHAVMLMPLFPHEVRGVEPLGKVAEIMFAG